MNVRTEEYQLFQSAGVTGEGAGCVWGLLQGDGDAHVKGLSRWVGLAGSGTIRAAERQPHQGEPLYRALTQPMSSEIVTRSRHSHPHG